MTKTINKTCKTCGGEGEVRTMERVWSGEPHMADIGTAPCPECRRKVEDEDREPEDDY